MSLAPILLALIADAPSSGYSLKKRIDEELSPLWSAELSQIYPVLERLHRSGFLAGRVVGPARGPASYRYRLTVSGRRELARWLAQPPGPTALRDETLARFVISEALGMRDPEALAGYERALGEEATRLRRRTGTPLALAARDAALARLDGIRRWARAREAPGGGEGAPHEIPARRAVRRRRRTRKVK